MHDQFHPERMADRILGMGDIVSLVERAQEQYDEEEARRLHKRLQKSVRLQRLPDTNCTDQKMGNLKGWLHDSGVGKAIKDIDIDDNAFKKALRPLSIQ